MANIQFDQARVEKAIDAIVHQTMNMDMTWDWPCGVAYFGICEAWRVTGRQEYLDLVEQIPKTERSKKIYAQCKDTQFDIHTTEAWPQLQDGSGTNMLP